MREHDVVIVGATGLVGTTVLSVLEARAFPIRKLYVVASEQSAGKKIVFRGKELLLEELSIFDFSQTTLAFFCVGNELAAKYVPLAVKAGNTVIDKSYFYRHHEEVPLVIPEVNLATLAHFTRKNIIANPNCTTIPIAVALKPIYDAVGIARMNIATYQAVSGTGKEAISELTEQTKQLLTNQQVHSKVYEEQIAFNVLPHCDEFQDNGYTREEMKIVTEIQKIFNDKTLAINPTAVRVPVFFSHAISVHLETKSKISAKEATQLLAQAKGVKVFYPASSYPTPAKQATGTDEVHVGRIREDISHPLGLNLWIVTDNLRKGAALNAVQIAEYLVRDYLT